MFGSLLIANRGEIARRIIRTAKCLGIRTIAVYSDADESAPHVAEADAAIRIGPAPARESYLRVDAIMAAARRTGAEALHPGYGFLSEKAELPRACLEAGITFVGPPAEVIQAMGSKIGAKRLAVASNVPVIPGFDGDDGSDATLVAAARDVGFPLLVKASAGGGGKGMRAVETAAALSEAIAAARREAMAAFGDDRLLLERLVRNARHVEVQVAADDHGNVLHLYERDCSVQRNNQKIFEEAPAPNLDGAVRSCLLGDAVRLARDIGYRNLGTMEFLVDAASGEHFFLEMNTRLQVEHPVTEAITGLDLVEMQLRIASGERLALGQAEIACKGHAIEARLTAERPEAGFMPSSGRITLWQPVLPIPGIRVDAGVETGSDVPLHYDSMIAKLIAHGADRTEALAKLRHALEGLTVLGLDTNRAFLGDVAKDGPFAKGRATTSSLKAAFPEGWQRPLPPAPFAAGLAAAIWASSRGAKQTSAGVTASPWSSLTGFRVLAAAGRPAMETFVVDLTRGPENAAVITDGGKTGFLLDGVRHAISLQDTHRGSIAFRCGDDHRRGLATIDDETVWIRCGAAEFSARVRTTLAAHEPAKSNLDISNSLRAPMPGIVAEVKVKAGDRFEEGDALVVLESMKLFQTLNAPEAGKVGAIHVQAGQSVPAGFELVSLELGRAAPDNEPTR